MNSLVLFILTSEQVLCTLFTSRASGSSSNVKGASVVAPISAYLEQYSNDIQYMVTSQTIDHPQLKKIHNIFVVWQYFIKNPL